MATRAESAGGDRGQQTRARIIDAGIEQLAGEGMRGLTHRKVERRAGVSQGLVTYHFGSLDGLVEAILATMVEAQIDLVLTVTPQEQAAGTESGMLPPGLLERMHASMAAALADTRMARARFELYLQASDQPRLQDIIRAARATFVARVATSLPGPDPEAAARMVVALVDGIVLDQLSAPEPVVRDLAPLYVLAAGAAAMKLPARSSLPWASRD